MMIVDLPYHLVDVFTCSQFGGNQLAVFPFPGSLSKEQMQRISNEMNLSETAFVLPADDPGADCRVRIFTPKVELPMAGHPTIGTAFVILQQGLLTPKHSRHLLFEEGVGTVRVDFDPADLVKGRIFMNQPLPEYGAVYGDLNALAGMLSVGPGDIDGNSPAQAISCGMGVLIVRLKSLEAVRSARLRLDLWERHLSGFETGQIMIFTTETEETGSTVHSRFFAPALGIMEDPATGAASGPLGCYLVRHGIVSGEKALSMVSEQGFEIGRKSRVHISIETDGGSVSGVKVGGKTSAVCEGVLHLRYS